LDGTLVGCVNDDGQNFPKGVFAHALQERRTTTVRQRQLHEHEIEYHAFAQHRPRLRGFRRHEAVMIPPRQNPTHGTARDVAFVEQ
jgi:hypothetical protein